VSEVAVGFTTRTNQGVGGDKYNWVSVGEYPLDLLYAVSVIHRYCYSAYNKHCEVPHSVRDGGGNMHADSVTHRDSVVQKDCCSV
jgi:hypothetical protein